MLLKVQKRMLPSSSVLEPCILIKLLLWFYNIKLDLTVQFRAYGGFVLTATEFQFNHIMKIDPVLCVIAELNCLFSGGKKQSSTVRLVVLSQYGVKTVSTSF
jgi:hypothetical protein